MKPGPDEFVPDVMVFEANGEDVRFTGVPALLVEVLPTKRADLETKSGRYAAAGAPHYWIVDPRDRVLDAYDLVDGFYRLVARVDETATPVAVPFAG